MSRPGPQQKMSDSSRDAVADALAMLGAAQIRWKGTTVHFERDAQRIQLGAEVIPAWIREIAPPIDRERVAMAMSDVTGITPPRSIAADLDRIRDRIFPRLVSREAFAGPDRAMNRREVGTDLYAAIWIALGGRGLWVTTAELDAWPIDFEDCFLLAGENLRARTAHGTVNEISDGHGVLASLADGVEMSGVMLDLPHVLPEQFAPGAGGTLVAAPSSGTLLMFPVRPENGAEGVASIVQIADMLRDPDEGEEIASRIYWAIVDPDVDLLGYRLEMLPVTVVHEGGARRAHVDSSDLVKALLRRLGEIE